MPTPTAGRPAERAAAPLPPPRAFSDRYAWQLMWSDGWAIAALVFSILGAIDTLVGAVLTASIAAAFVGLPFFGLGVLGLAGGVLLGGWRYQAAVQIVRVLRSGEAADGRITQVEQNLHVRVNRRHPWIIRYTFTLAGQTYAGEARTLNSPGPELQPEQPVWVLYLPEAPAQNTLYPHP